MARITSGYEVPTIEGAMDVVIRRNKIESRVLYAARACVEAALYGGRISRGGGFHAMENLSNARSRELQARGKHHVKMKLECSGRWMANTISS
jgi:hypothetical protein